MSSNKFTIAFSTIITLAIITIAVLYLPQTKSRLSSSSKPTLITDPSPLTTLFFAGDIMLSRNVAAKMITAEDYTLPFQKVADFVKSSDISFANLESPFNTTGDHSIEGSLVFNADPLAAAGLTYSGFDVLSTANNHAFDQGTKGIDTTIQVLKDHNIIPVGTFATTDKTPDPSVEVIRKNGINFGFLSYSYTAQNDGGKTTSPYVSDFNNLTKLKQDIFTLKGHYADVVIVNMHAGVEYTRKPTQAQIDFAHAAIDAGADIVIGEHPHWVQTIEQYNGKWIFYSLGNFVFDQMWSQDTREGMTMLVSYDKNEIKKIELKPVIIDNFCCPRWATDEETKSILTKIDLTSTTLVPHN